MLRKILFLLLSVPLIADNKKPLLSIGAGFFNITGVHKRYIYQAEYKWAPVVDHLRPLAGIFVTERGSTYFYGGISYDILIGKKIVFTPSLAAGIYFQGKGKNLGYPVEFRSAAELAYQFKRGDRFGAMFYHISNSHLSRRNPGANILVAFYAFAL